MNAPKALSKRDQNIEYKEKKLAKFERNLVKREEFLRQAATGRVAKIHGNLLAAGVEGIQDSLPGLRKRIADMKTEIAKLKAAP